MSAKHTSGPWVVIDDDHAISVDGEGWLDGQHVNGWVVIGNPDNPEMAIAVLDTGSKNYWHDEKLDANAALVAAAPDFYDVACALELLLREREGELGRLSPQMQVIAASNRAALAKARGQS